MNDFENKLRRLPLRPVPAEWRAGVLHAARATAVSSATVPWRERWLPPQPFALAAAWLLIAVLRFSTPDNAAAPSPVTLTDLEARVRTQQDLIAELLNPPVLAAPQPASPHGAVLSRRAAGFRPT